MDTNAIKVEMINEAQAAAQRFADQRFGGQDGGPCGFAWVTIMPANKGNTKAGKLERQTLKAMGFEQDWTGKAYQVWDPARWAGQSVDVKEAGANAAAQLLKKHGFNAYAGSRLD
jgi:hypothetical protein